MLEVSNLRIAYDRAVAVHGLDLRVDEGEVVAIVGPNGAGKTSTMMAISGVVAPEAGQVRFRGKDITRAPSHDIYRRGIVQVPEGRLIFSELTVGDNLLLGAHAHGATERANPDLERVFELFPVLRERLRQRADTLSGGQLQMLAIARGLMGRPKLFMLDEPSLGLAPLVAEEVFGMIARLSRRGMTILLVEQNVRRALEISDRAYLLEAGRLVETGGAADLLESDLVMESYLGTRSSSSIGSSRDAFAPRSQSESGPAKDTGWRTSC